MTHLGRICCLFSVLLAAAGAGAPQAPGEVPGRGLTLAQTLLLCTQLGFTWGWSLQADQMLGPTFHCLPGGAAVHARTKC